MVGINHVSTIIQTTVAWRRGSPGRPMANQVIVSRLKSQVGERKATTGPRPLPALGNVPKFALPEVHKSMLGSLIANIKDTLYPERLPPLQLTSRPVAV